MSENIKQESLASEPEEETWFEVPFATEQIQSEQLFLCSHHEVKEEMAIGPTEIQQPYSVPSMSVNIKCETSEPIKTEHEETAETPSKEVTAAVEPMQSERALLYAGHQIKDEMVIGPTEIQQPAGVNPPHWEAARHHTETNSCHQRKATFKLKDNLKQHKVVTIPINTLSCVCDVCSKLYPSKSSLNRHKLIHTGIRPFECDTCGKSFTYKHNLSEHMLLHNGSKAFECDQCNKSFVQRYTLYQHMLIHNGSRTFPCDECGKSFFKKSLLSRHMLIHSGNKAFSCERCGKRFSQKSNLSRHMLIHNGSQSFSCTSCDKSFTQKSNLFRYMLTHSRRKPFTCDECGKSFALKWNLSQHRRIHNRSKRKS